MKDLVDLPKKVRQDLNIVPVTHMDKVLELALRPATGKKSRPKQKKAKKETESKAEPIKAELENKG